MIKGTYKNNRPILLIERDGGGQLGNCYYNAKYLVTSTIPLCGKDLLALRDMGLMMNGQEFYYYQKVKGGIRDVPIEHVIVRYVNQAMSSGEDDVACVDIANDGTETPSIDHNGVHIPPIKCKYYIYSVECRVDSSD